MIFYCVVCACAFRSAMISLILIGAGFILTGSGFGLIAAFKRYYAFYDKSMGWQHPDKTTPEEKTSVEDNFSFKKYLTLPNIALVALLIGSVFTIISAALGCVDRSKWIDAVGPYREAHGYFADVKSRDLKFAIEDPSTHAYDLDEIDFDLISKKAEIVFTDDEDKLGFITVKAFVSYENQLVFAYNEEERTFSVSENPAPSAPRSALDKLLFFVNDLPSDKRVIVYLPSALKDVVQLDGV